ncbi:hypothetical protein D3C80_871010 [compost metagenome]
MEKEEFIRKKEYEKNSYIWDGLIEAFSFHILNGTSESNKNWSDIHEIESKIRIMAKTNRFQRRILGEAFLDMFHKFKEKRGTRIVHTENLDQKYLFVGLPFTYHFRGNVELYRTIRRQMLQDYAYIYKHLNYDLESLVLIGFRSPTLNEQLSKEFLDDGNDFGYIAFDDWSNGEQQDAKNIYENYVEKNLFTDRNFTLLKANEFNQTAKIIL